MVVGIGLEKGSRPGQLSNESRSTCTNRGLRTSFYEAIDVGQADAGHRRRTGQVQDTQNPGVRGTRSHTHSSRSSI